MQVKDGGFVFDICLADNNQKQIFLKDLKNNQEIGLIVEDFCALHNLNDIQKSAILEIIGSYKRELVFDSLNSYYSIETFDKNEKFKNSFNIGSQKKRLRKSEKLSRKSMSKRKEETYKKKSLKNINKLTKEKINTNKIDLKDDKYIKNYFGNYNYYPESYDYRKYIKEKKINFVFPNKLKRVFAFISKNQNFIRFENIDFDSFKNEYISKLKNILILIIRKNKNINFEQFCSLIKRNNLLKDVNDFFDVLNQNNN